jgi:hypothetical protein
MLENKTLRISCIFILVKIQIMTQMSDLNEANVYIR